MALKEGDKAPAFRAATNAGGSVTLGEFLGEKNVVIYFYPKDDTPGCTIEACAFRDAMESFHSADSVVLGVSRDPAASHDDFIEKYHLPFLLLADESGEVGRAYGALKEGGQYMDRMTVVVDKQGLARKIFRDVNVETHVKEVLDALAGF